MRSHFRFLECCELIAQWPESAAAAAAAAIGKNGRKRRGIKNSNVAA